MCFGTDCTAWILMKSEAGAVWERGIAAWRFTRRLVRSAKDSVKILYTLLTLCDHPPFSSQQRP